MVQVTAPEGTRRLLEIMMDSFFFFSYSGCVITQWVIRVPVSQSSHWALSLIVVQKGFLSSSSLFFELRLSCRCEYSRNLVHAYRWDIIKRSTRGDFGVYLSSAGK
ncbi:hypothetical protein CEXT_113751 [Caerostris extrusa]|uniref:Uncharacterized protein n=1 Tax=Caerostris extrusa TaxID=172846 RepID=A0AAV4QTY9_CAEEX|nr:hypothetical protein CEXT_113751 [Caerostris extrusa]